jgi:hypothetical protein
MTVFYARDGWRKETMEAHTLLEVEPQKNKKYYK